MRFRTKLFLAVLLPSCALVAVAVGTALFQITRATEDGARDELARTAGAFRQVLEDQLLQLQSVSRPFAGSRFDAAVSEAVESGDLEEVRKQLDYQFKLVGVTPDFYELRDKAGKVLLRKSVVPEVDKAEPGEPQKWMAERDHALTQFAGQPFLSLRFDHDKGMFIVGKHLRESLTRLRLQFATEVSLFSGPRLVFSSLGEGALRPGKTRYLSIEATPKDSELSPVHFLKDMSQADRDVARVVAVGAAGLMVSVLAALLVSVLVSRGVSQPVEALVEASHKIAAGDYKVRVDIQGRDEIARLGGAFNEMTEGLRKRQEIMDKTLSHEVAEEFLKGTDRRPDRRIVTIVFMDIRGYTSGTEGMDPADVVVMLNELMDLLSGAIVRNGGIVNKFLGDGLMAMFGAPKPLEGHALHAVRAGLEMQKWMARWNDRRIARGLPSFYSGIGINTGVAMCGKVGAQDRMEYTLIGEEVNLASRICGKAAPKQVLVTKQTWDMVKDRIQGRELEPVQVKGLSYPIKVYEVLE